MQPYQEASQEIRRQANMPQNAIKSGAKIATSAIGGSALLNRILPFLSPHIPQNLVEKGLNKIDPRLGKFIKQASKSGKSFQEIRDFIGDKLNPESNQKNKEPTKDKRNIIEQYSPELHQFIDQEIKKGRNPIEAAALAQNDKRFSSVINKLSKDHKTPWSSIIESIFGNGQTAQQDQSKAALQQEQPQQQGGQGQQALMAILQKIQQTRGQ